MAEIKVDHPQLPLQLGSDSIHSLDGLADDWAQDGTDDITLTDLQHVLVDMGQETGFLSNWMDTSVDEISQSSSTTLAEEFIRHWSDDGERQLTNVQGSAGDSFGEAFLSGHDFFETSTSHTLALLDFPIDEDSGCYKPPPKSKRRVRFQCPPDPECDDDAESNSNRKTDCSEQPTWAWPTDDWKEENPYFDPYDQFQSAESDSNDASDSILFRNTGGLEILEADGKDNSIECFYCHELFMPREPSIVNMTNWNYLCPSCIMRLCERPNQQM